MVVCKLYDSSQKDIWNSCVELSKTPLFFFKREFLEYHADRFIDLSLMFYEDDILIAVLPASKNGDVLTSHGGLTYGGLLTSSKIRSETIHEILSALVNQVSILGIKKILYKAIPYVYYKQGAQDELYFISNVFNGKIYRRDLSSVIYLQDRLKLSKGRKWLIARAKKIGLAVSESTDWESFYSLLSSVLLKHDAVPVHSVAELIYLSQLFPNNIKLKIVELDGVLLSAALLFIFDGVVHTQYLATSEEGKEMGALDFLIESCIQESQTAGYTYFSFGVSTEDQGKVLNHGLISQKESFGARGLVLDFYEINLK